MIRAAVITASDKGFAGARTDESGEAIKELIKTINAEVVEYLILPDERKMLADNMRRICDEGSIDLILTTGGTGLSPRDVTPEATLDIIERQVPGIPEAMRSKSLEITSRAMLSRAVSGIRNRTLIINLPGSPKAVRESLEVVLPVLNHAIEILKGQTGECARI